MTKIRIQTPMYTGKGIYQARGGVPSEGSNTWKRSAGILACAKPTAEWTGGTGFKALEVQGPVWG